MKKVKRYKSTRKYRCPYCNITATRDKLAAHIEDKHEAMIPEGYTATRVLYDYINKKNYGTCLVCKKKVYEWDDNVCRYKNICDDPKCLATLKERAGHNHLEDPEVQKKLLAGRRISGQYTFHDGVTHSYVGSYERNCFEFMDTVLNIPGKDIMSPGPTIYYEYKGEEHPWILDWMYIPAMLCADVKDGGSNPNNRPMEEYREKQLAKEEAISKLGKYNYIRLTDNNFSQLLEALADIRMGSIHHDPLSHIYINEAYQISDETKKMVAGLEQYFPEVSNAKFVTNYPKFQYEDAYKEAVGGMPSFRGNGSDYIVPHMMNGIEFHDDGRPMMTFGNTASDDVLQFDYMMKPHKHKKHDDYMMPLIDSYRFICKSNILPSLINDTKTLESLGEDGLIEKMTGRKFTGFKDLLCEDVVKISSDTDNDLVRSLITNGIVKNVTSVINESKMIAIQEEFVESKGDISIYKDTDGFFCCTPQDYYLVSNHYDTYEDIPQAVIDTMQVMYTRRKGGKR